MPRQAGVCGRVFRAQQLLLTLALAQQLLLALALLLPEQAGQ